MQKYIFSIKPPNKAYNSLLTGKILTFFTNKHRMFVLLLILQADNILYFPHKQSSDSSSVSEEKKSVTDKESEFFTVQLFGELFGELCNPLFSPLSGAVFSEPRLEAFSVPLFLPP